MTKRSFIYFGVVFALIGLTACSSRGNAPVDESPPTMAPAEINVQATQSIPTAMVEPTTMVEESTPEADMQVLAQGEFYDVVHVGSGQAVVYQLADGSRVLQLQGFRVEDGPDLHVYLVPIDPVSSESGSEIPGSVDLGALKSDTGSQEYEIPADLDLSQFKSLVIWCQPFRVPFIAAPLRPQ